MIELDDVQLSFGDVAVLDGIDLTVEPGEFVAIVGPNGAGKTTVLRAINGVLEPDAGHIRLDGQPASSLSARAISRQVATVPQNTHVGFSFRAEQIVEMGRTPHRSRLDWSDDADPVDAALEQTETTHLRDRQVDDLSGGERQRILLARAIAQEPRALLLDEPTASLDINHQIRVLGLVEDLVDDGRAALAAIHDLDLAARYCDRLLLLHDGEIRSRGRPENVLEDPILADAFETNTAVTRNPVTGTPTVAALEARPNRESHVHVSGGGRGSVTAIRTLWQAGFEVTVGPVPDGDVAADLAGQLDLDVITSPAFELPDETRRAAAVDVAAEADALVLTEGHGSEFVEAATESTPHVHANLAGTGAAVARVDGGTTEAVSNETELIEAVLACIGEATADADEHGDTSEKTSDGDDLSH